MISSEAMISPDATPFFGGRSTANLFDCKFHSHSGGGPDQRGLSARFLVRQAFSATTRVRMKAGGSNWHAHKFHKTKTSIAPPQWIRHVQARKALGPTPTTRTGNGPQHVPEDSGPRHTAKKNKQNRRSNATRQLRRGHNGTWLRRSSSRQPAALPEQVFDHALAPNFGADQDVARDRG